MLNKDYVKRVYGAMLDVKSANVSARNAAYGFLQRASLSREELVYFAEQYVEMEKEPDEPPQEYAELSDKLSKVKKLLTGLEGKLPDELRAILE